MDEPVRPRELAQDDPARLEEAVYGDEAPAGRPVGVDPHDFAGLYVRHRSSFAAQARRFLRDPRDVDEVVQEAFLRLFLALPELGTELQAIAYCRRTITNLCIDRYRADQRRPRMLGLESAPAEVLLEDEPVDPVVQAEDAAVVREALSRLQPLHREALVKREIEEKPLPVIAAELDVPEESVKHLLFRARRALRRLLAGSTADPGHLVRIAAGSGGRLGVLIALVVAGLGSGPDLRVVPVVGKDLPDLPSVAEVLVETLPQVLPPPVRPAEEPQRPVQRQRPVERQGPVAPPLAPEERVERALEVSAAPAPAVLPSPATSPSPPVALQPTALPTPAVLPTPSAPAGAGVGEPSASPSASPGAAAAPTATASPGRPGTAVIGGTPTASPGTGSAAPSPQPSPQASGGQGGTGGTAAPRPSGSAAPGPYASGGPAAQPSAEATRAPSAQPSAQSTGSPEPAPARSAGTRTEALEQPTILRKRLPPPVEGSGA